MRLLSAVVAVTLVLTACSQTPQPSPSQPPPTPPVVIEGHGEPAPALPPTAAADVAEAAAAEGVPAAELETRMADTATFAELLNAYPEDYPDTFTAGGLVRDGRDQPWVAFTAEPPAAVRAELALLPHTTLLITDAPVAASQVERAAQMAVKQVRRRTRATSVQAYLDEATFGLQVTFTGGDPGPVAAAGEALDQAVRAVAPGLPEVTLDRTPGPPLRLQVRVKGGRPLFRNGTAVCTGGFTAVRRGRRGLISAQHCPRAVRYNNRRGVIRAGARARRTANGQVDLRFFRTLRPHRTTPAFRATGTGRIGDRTVRTTGNPVVGQAVCKWGRYSRYGCSVVVTVNVCAAFVDGRVRCGLAKTSRNITVAGDSGGPWFVGRSARGITTGADANSSVFTQISKVRSHLRARVLRK